MSIGETGTERQFPITVGVDILALIIEWNVDHPGTFCSTSMLKILVATIQIVSQAKFSSHSAFLSSDRSLFIRDFICVLLKYHGRVGFLFAVTVSKCSGTILIEHRRPFPEDIWGSTCRLNSPLRHC